MSATKEQVLDAARALGYDPITDELMSIYADTEQVIVRRLERSDTGLAVVEDVTVLRPDRAPARQHPDIDLGPLQ